MRADPNAMKPMLCPQWKEMELGTAWYLEYVFLCLVGNLVVAGGLELAHRYGLAGVSLDVHRRQTQDMRPIIRQAVNDWDEHMAPTVVRSVTWG